MKSLFFLIIFSVLGVQMTMALSTDINLQVGSLTELEQIFTVWDVLEPNSVEDKNTTPVEYSAFYRKEMHKDTIFHINNTERIVIGNGRIDTLDHLYPVVKLDFFYVFNKKQAGGIGYIGLFEYNSIIYNRKSILGIRVRTTVGYEPYH